MKTSAAIRLSLLSAALLSLLAAVSCSEAAETVRKTETLTVTLPSPPKSATRALGDRGWSERAVSSLQVMAFSESGLIEDYGRSGGSGVTLKCTPGSKQIWAFVNAPDMSGIASLSGLGQRSIRLSDNTPVSLVMSGWKGVVVRGSSRDTVTVSRLCAKVSVKGITKAFSSPVLQSKAFVVNKIYMTNVPGSRPVQEEEGGEPEWLNKMGYQGDCDALLCDIVGEQVDDVYSEEHTFYVFPNSKSPDIRGGSWSPRGTRLVIDASIDSERCFYVLDIPDIEANHSYTFSNITITRRGSDDEESATSPKNVRYTLEVTPWEDEEYKYSEYL